MRYTVIGILILSVIFSSCDKSSDNREDGLQGTWLLTEVEGSAVSNLLIIDGEFLPGNFSVEGCDLDYLVTFDENDATFTTEGVYSIKYTSLGMPDSTVHTNVHDDHHISSTYMTADSSVTSDQPILKLTIPTIIGERNHDLASGTITTVTEDDLVLRYAETKFEEDPSGTLMTKVDILATWRKK